MNSVLHRIKWDTFVRCLVIFTVVGLGAGCTRLIHPPEDQPRARALLNILADANQELSRFKGLGQVHLAMPEVNMAGRIAVAVEMPDKMRIEWLSALGQPLLRLAANGKTIAIFSAQTSKVHRFEQTDKILERIVHIPITVESLLAVLSGRIPHFEYIAAQILQESDTHMVVGLKDRWSATLATVEVDLQTRQMNRLTAFNSDGNVRYRINWLQWQHVQGYLLPRDLEIAVNDVHRMKLTMDRFWCNVPLPQGIFSEVVAKQQ